jgi:hypothetical protein
MRPDFDGTIFMQDTGRILFDAHGCGSKRRAILDEQIKTGERSFREVSEEMWGSLNVPFEDGFEVMEKELEIDPDFQQFHKFCIRHEIPFNVISAGLKPILRKVRTHRNRRQRRRNRPRRLRMEAPLATRQSPLHHQRAHRRAIHAPAPRHAPAHSLHRRRRVGPARGPRGGRALRPARAAARRILRREQDPVCRLRYVCGYPARGRGCYERG